MSRITFDEISKILSIQFWYKCRYTRYMWSNYMFIHLHFSCFFIKIENAVYTSFQKITFLFINRLIFDIMNTNQSLEFEWKPMLAPLRFINDRRFSWLCNVVPKSFQDWLNSAQQAKEILQKRLARKCSYREQTYEGLIINVNPSTEATQFFFWHQVKYVLIGRFCRFCRDFLENWFCRQRSSGLRKDI